MVALLGTLGFTLARGLDAREAWSEVQAYRHSPVCTTDERGDCRFRRTGTLANVSGTGKGAVVTVDVQGERIEVQIWEDYRLTRNLRPPHWIGVEYWRGSPAFIGTDTVAGLTTQSPQARGSDAYGIALVALLGTLLSGNGFWLLRRRPAAGASVRPPFTVHPSRMIPLFFAALAIGLVLAALDPFEQTLLTRFEILGELRAVAVPLALRLAVWYGLLGIRVEDDAIVFLPIRRVVRYSEIDGLAWDPAHLTIRTRGGRSHRVWQYERDALERIARAIVERLPPDASGRMAARSLQPPSTPSLRRALSSVRWQRLSRPTAFELGTAGMVLLLGAGLIGSAVLAPTVWPLAFAGLFFLALGALTPAQLLWQRSLRRRLGDHGQRTRGEIQEVGTLWPPYSFMRFTFQDVGGVTWEAHAWDWSAALERSRPGDRGEVVYDPQRPGSALWLGEG